MMEWQRLWVLGDTVLYFIHLKIELPDTESSVCAWKSTDGASTSIPILLTLPLISRVRLQLSLAPLLERCSYKCMQICFFFFKKKARYWLRVCVKQNFSTLIKKKKKRFASSRSFSFAVLEWRSQNCSSVSPDLRRASVLFNCPHH